jgi:hypothetical protein
LELRGRYHLPISDGRESTLRSVQTFDINESRNLSGGARLQTDGVVTVRSTLTLLTESLPGWEVEASALVPGLDRWMDVNLTAGYASYKSNTFAAINYDTWRFGIEARPVPAVVLGATYFGNERIVGDHWMFSIGMELPFETANIGNGKGGFWGHIKDAFKSRRRHLSERLREPVRKQSLPMQFASGATRVKTQVNAKGRSVVLTADGRVVEAGSFSSQSSSAVNDTSTFGNSSVMATLDTSIGAGANLIGGTVDSPQPVGSTVPATEPAASATP